MAVNKNFAHVAVRFPTEMLARLHSQQAAEGARSLTAVIRAELEVALQSRRVTTPILSQAARASRSELWLPLSLVNRLRRRAERADATVGDLIVTLLAKRPVARSSARRKTDPAAPNTLTGDDARGGPRPLAAE